MILKLLVTFLVIGLVALSCISLDNLYESNKEHNYPYGRIILGTTGVEVDHTGAYCHPIEEYSWRFNR